MNLLNVRYDNLTVPEALDRMCALMEQPVPSDVFFLNLDCLRISHYDAEYCDILRRASMVLSDGIGLRIATILFGGRMRGNCNGTDLSPLFLRAAAEKGYKVFFLGGVEGVAIRAAENLQKTIPSLRIVGTRAGYLGEEADVIRAINESGADILLVAMGVPLQEKWIMKHRNRLNAKLCMGVGGLFDWLSGRKKRAPKILREMNLEWLWRIMIDFRRMFKRYVLHDLFFLFRLVWLRIAGIFKSK